MRSPDSLTARQIARLADLSEAHAYEALVECAAAVGDRTFDTVRIGSAVALRSRSVRSSVLFNRLIGLGLSEEATEQMLDEAAALYAADKIPWGVELSPAARPPDLPDWLRKRRMRRGLATALLIRSCFDVPEIKTDLRIERVGPEFGTVVAGIAAPIFRVAPEVKALLEVAATQPGYRQWLAFDGNEPVGSCLSYVREDVVWLGWDATLLSHRGRGVHAAFLVARMLDAAEAGCEWCTAETALGTPENPDPSLRNFLRMGFKLAYERHTYIALSR